MKKKSGKKKSGFFYLVQESGGGSEVVRAVGEGTVLGLQGAALRVVVKKPARARFQGARGNGPPLGVPPGGLAVPPVSYGDPPSFNCGGEKRIRAVLDGDARPASEDTHL